MNFIGFQRQKKIPFEFAFVLPKGLFPRPLFLGEMRKKFARNVLIHAQ